MNHPWHPVRSAARFRSHAALASAWLLASTALGGCGLGVHGHRGEPTARAKASQETEAPKLTDTQKKLADAREQATLNPAEPYWPYRQAQVYVESDSLARAETALRASIVRDPGYLPALMLLSKLYYDAGRNEDGVALLEAARERATATPDGVPPALAAGLALHYEALGRHDQAAAVAGTATRAADGKAATALAYITLRGDHPEAADDLARAALDNDPHSAANQNNYGITRLRAGDPKTARDAFLKAIDLDPKLPGPYYNLSIVERFFFFDEEAASRWLKAYRERSSDDPDNLFGPVATSKPATPPATTGKEH